jgi:hypothetical protein
MSTKYRVNLSRSLAARVTALADSWGLPVATFLRLAARDLCDHPERLPEMIVAPSLVTQDETSTPEQRANAAAYIRSLHGFDLAAELGVLPHDKCPEEGYK